MRPIAKALRVALAVTVTAGLLAFPGLAGAQAAEADLSVDKADTPDPAASGAPITYTVTVDNDGPDEATQVELEDVLPLGSTFVSALPSQGTCSQLLLVVTCDLGSLADEATATVAIVITHAGSGTINNLVAVESTVPDTNPLNNVASESTTITDGTGGDGADLRVEKADAPDPVAPNANLTYVATVANLGSTGATGVVLTDVLPLNVQFVSATTSQGSCSEPVLVVLTCQLGDVADDESATVTIVVKPIAEGTVANTVTVAGSSPDTNPANNLSTATTTVSADAQTPGGGPGGGGSGGGGLAACTIMGTSLADKLTGTQQNDVICGLDGNDLLRGLGGKDALIGGKNNDKGNGGKGPDVLKGQAGKDKLRGAAKNDRLSGGGSGDRLNGGPGKDRLNGGAGKDRCRWGPVDRVTKCP
jgi:uncharacterized repeat protein (TIGR01451 family)